MALNPTEVTSSDTVTVTGAGFQPESNVTLFLDTAASGVSSVLRLSDLVTSSAGGFVRNVTIPKIANTSSTITHSIKSSNLAVEAKPLVLKRPMTLTITPTSFVLGQTFLAAGTYVL